MLRLSIILPVYNCEKYVGECIESILRQDFPGFELIIVDDGSTDLSPEICSGFTADPRVRLITKHNEGVSVARNTGLSIASAPLVMFVDSDDMLEQGMLSAMMRQMQGTDSDLCVCGLRNFHKDSSKDELWVYKGGIYTKDEYADVLLHFYTNPFVGGPYAKLYRRNIIVNNGILFEPRESFAEDFVFNMRYLRHTSKVSVLSASYYLRRADNPASLSKAGRLQIPHWERKKAVFQEWNATLACLSDGQTRDSFLIQKFAIGCMADILFSKSENRSGTVRDFIRSVLADTDRLIGGRGIPAYEIIRRLFRLCPPICLFCLRAAGLLHRAGYFE